MQRLSEGYCVLAVVLLVAALSSACRNTGGGLHSGEVYVYVAVPLSGDWAEADQSVLGGTRLAAEVIKREGDCWAGGWSSGRWMTGLKAMQLWPS